MKLLGNRKGKVLVIGCFHGDEPQGKYLIDEYIKSVKSTNLAFIDCLNEYGYLNNSRVNKNGVDLNRNFPTKNWELSERNEFFGGESAGSETETQFLINIVNELNPKLILTLHAPYKIVNYDGNAEAISNKISEIIGYPVESSIGYPTPGSFGTWAGVEKEIPTVTLELDEKIDVKELKKPVFKIFELLEKE